MSSPRENAPAPEEQPLPAGCTKNADGTITVVLDFPVKIGEKGEPVPKLTIRRPKGAALRLLNTSDEGMMSSLIDIAGKACGQNPVFMNELDAADLTRVLGVVGRFLPSTRLIGGG